MTAKQHSLGDHYAEVTVILVTVAALLVGWLYKSGVENASIPFNADGVSAQAPSGWLSVSPGGDELLRTRNINSRGFGATYVVRKIAAAEGVSASEMAGVVALEHANNLTAFRMLDQREVKVNGQTAFEISYVFVESNPDVTQTQIPSVVRGTDYVFLKGGHAIVVSFQSDEKNYNADLDRFHRFLQSLRF